MTVFNSEKYLFTSIKSILNQSYKKWELIIVDDGSDDNSRKIIKKIKDKRIKFFFLKKHVGRIAAFNYALKKCKGEYIAILDSDDISHKERLKIQIKNLEKTKKTLLVVSWFKYIDTKNRVFKKFKFNYKDIINKHSYRNVLSFSSFMFRRSVLRKINMTNNLNYAFDWGFSLKVFKISKIEIIPKFLCLNRVHRDRLSLTKDVQKDIITDTIKIFLWSFINIKSNLLTKTRTIIEIIKYIIKFLIHLFK